MGGADLLTLCFTRIGFVEWTLCPLQLCNQLGVALLISSLDVALLKLEFASGTEGMQVGIVISCASSWFLRLCFFADCRLLLSCAAGILCCMQRCIKFCRRLNTATVCCTV